MTSKNLAKTEVLARTWSPPSSPDPQDSPVIPTNDRGMVIGFIEPNLQPNQDGITSTKRKRRTLHYVSRHFASPQMEVKKNRDGLSRKRRKLAEDEKENVQDGRFAQAVITEQKKEARQETQRASRKQKNTATTRSRKKKEQSCIPGSPQEESQLNKSVDEQQKDPATGDAGILVPWQKVLAAPVEQQQQTFARIYFGLNVDELSSDSDLTDVPDGIEDVFSLQQDVLSSPLSSSPSSPSPHRSASSLSSILSSPSSPALSPPTTPKWKSIKKRKTKEAESVVVKEPKLKAKVKPKAGLTKSPYFPHPHKQRSNFLSTLPFPPLDIERFGLMQERLCHDPYRLLLATIFLNKTPGSRAMPIFYKLMERYPTPEKLAAAEQSDVTEIIRELGFQNQRARKCIAMSQRWIEDPPVKGRRWRKLGYPRAGDGKTIKADEVVDDGDERVAWEISHLPGLGPYSHDSWRMFCRDELRDLASAYNGEGVKHGDGEDFEPEWKRVLPTDKELRAWMTWMWMKEGWVWNKETGERTKASDELMELARGKGNVVLESADNTLHVKSLKEDQPSSLKLNGAEKENVKVDKPAGECMPAAGSGKVA